MPALPSSRPIIRVSGVTRTVDARLFKLMSDICNLEPQPITLSQLAAILDAGFKPEIYARTDNFCVEDRAGIGQVTFANKPPSLRPGARERLAEMLNDLKQTKAA